MSAYTEQQLNDQNTVRHFKNYVNDLKSELIRTQSRIENMKANNPKSYLEKDTTYGYLNGREYQIQRVLESLMKIIDR